MKHNKIFRTLAFVIVLCLLILAIPATPAAAQYLSCTPTSGTAGTPVTLTGTAYTIWTNQPVYIFFQYNLITSAIVTAYGSLSATFTIPSYATAGTSYITVQHTTPVYNPANQIGITPFTVTQAGITMSPSSGYVGDQITISGTGFTASSNVTIYFDADVVGTTSTGTTGSFTDATFSVPESYYGTHTVRAKDASNIFDTASFTTQQKITITPESGGVGDEVTVSGTGFRVSRAITITYDAGRVTTNPVSIATDAKGSFTASFSVPSSLADDYKVEASDGTYKASADFTVSTMASLSLTTGNVGDEITVSGSGFIAGKTVTTKYDDDQVATTTVKTNGTFSVTFTVPASSGGDHTVTVTDGTNTITSSFTMESTSPPIPEPLEPAVDTIIEKDSPAYFDWEDVKDPSGVTYTLQIANDEKFTKDSIVLDKTELTKSEYTLTEKDREELVPTEEKEATYYWRVKAIDGASNESDWTGSGSFIIPRPGITMPGWIMYVWIAVAAVFCGIIGFWLGRRTAYY